MLRFVGLVFLVLLCVVTHLTSLISNDSQTCLGRNFVLQYVIFHEKFFIVVFFLVEILAR